MTIYTIITTTRRFDYVTRAKMATDAEMLANIGRMVSVERMRG